MTPAKRTILLAITLFGATAAASLLSAFLLEAFTIRRVDGGSLTTHFPGFVYANATVLKVVIAETFLLLVSSFGLSILGNSSDRTSFLSVGSLSLLIQPAALLISTVVLLILQSILPHDSPRDSSFFSRVGVLALLCLIWVGPILSTAAMVRKERPLVLSLIGLMSNACLLILFYYFKFYKLGFDQDNWAN